MLKKEFIKYFFILLGISVFFFYKVFFNGYVPIPSDLLISEYNPWKTESYLHYTPGTYPNKLQYFDVIRQLYPWRTVSLDIIKHGQIPFWNPYNFSGSPLLANVQSAIFYPLNVFYFLFPQFFSWSLLVFLQPFLTSIFTYMYARKIGLKISSSLLTAISFSYSLFSSVFLEYNTINHVFLYLPLLLLIIENIINTVNFLNLFFFGCILAISAFAGHIQIFGFMLIFLFFYTIFRIFSISWSSKRRIYYIFLFSIIFICGLGTAAIQIIPTVELIHLSARTEQSYQFLLQILLLQPYQLILFFIPDLFGNPATRNYLINDTYPTNAVYIGIIPFLFSLFAININKKYFYQFFFTVSSFMLLIMLVKTPFSAFVYLLHIPLFSTGSPSNAIFLLSFSLSILSGFGLEQWLKNENKNRFFFIICATCVLFVLVLTIASISHTLISQKNFLYSLGIFSLFLFIIGIKKILPNKHNLFITLCFFIALIDLFYFFQKFNPFTPKELVFPPVGIFSFLQNHAGITRFWGYGSAAVDANFATQYRIFSPDGYDPLYPKYYGELLQSSIDGKIHEQFNVSTRSDAIIARGFGEKDLQNNIFRNKILNLLGVKYIFDVTSNASTEKTFPIQDYSLVYQNNPWRIFDNLHALPRFFIVDNYLLYKNTKDFSDIFFSHEFNPKKTVLVDTKIPHANLGPLLPTDRVEMLSYSPNTIQFKTFASSPKLLFLSDTFYPEWHAYIDGRMTNIYKADFAFRTIVIPEGIHSVTFSYIPTSFFLGLRITIISILVLLLFSYVFGKKKIYYA
jgi:hypothetical protein